MYLKEVAGHVVMEGDLDSKGGARREIMKTKTKINKNYLEFTGPNGSNFKCYASQYRSDDRRL